MPYSRKDISQVVSCVWCSPNNLSSAQKVQFLSHQTRESGLFLLLEFFNTKTTRGQCIPKTVNGSNVDLSARFFFFNPGLYDKMAVVVPCCSHNDNGGQRSTLFLETKTFSSARETSQVSLSSTVLCTSPMVHSRVCCNITPSHRHWYPQKLWSVEILRWHTKIKSHN